MIWERKSIVSCIRSLPVEFGLNQLLKRISHSLIRDSGKFDQNACHDLESNIESNIFKFVRHFFLADYAILRVFYEQLCLFFEGNAVSNMRMIEST